jgi:hypothetical protein
MLHCAVPVAPAAKVQLAKVGENVPVELLVKVTEPVGLVGDAEVSVIVAVHVLAVFTFTDAGEQATEVVVACSGAGVAANKKVPWLEE